MTVAELIEKLKEFDESALVIHGLATLFAEEVIEVKETMFVKGDSVVEGVKAVALRGEKSNAHRWWEKD